MAEERDWFPQEFPIYYSADAAFRVDSRETGDRGAEARVSITLNNAPTILLGLRVTMSWEPIVIEQELGPPLIIYQTEEFQRLDEECSVLVQLTQQNITAGTQVHHLRNLQGSRQINYHPFPAPYLARGGNTVDVTLRRLQSYPLIPRGDDPPAEIRPRAFVTLVAVSLVDSLVPQAGPPSTEDIARYVARRIG